MPAKTQNLAFRDMLRYYLEKYLAHRDSHEEMNDLTT